MQTNRIFHHISWSLSLLISIQFVKKHSIRNKSGRREKKDEWWPAQTPKHETPFVKIRNKKLIPARVAHHNQTLPAEWSRFPPKFTAATRASDSFMWSEMSPLEVVWQLWGEIKRVSTQRDKKPRTCPAIIRRRLGSPPPQPPCLLASWFCCLRARRRPCVWTLLLSKLRAPLN